MADNDSELLARVRAKDAQAMAEIYDRYAAVIYSLAVHILKDPAGAERIVEEILLNIWRDPSCGGATAALGTLLKSQTLSRALKLRSHHQVSTF